LGCLRAAANVRDEIAAALRGMRVDGQQAIDERMIELDGTLEKGRLGANAILAVSVACAKAAAATAGVSPFRHLGGSASSVLPAPMATVIAGGEFSSSALDFEDYLYVLDGFGSVAEAVEALWETRVVLEEMLAARFGVVPEIGGALAPPMSDSREAFEIMLEAAQRAGCRGRARLGLDVAASELYDDEHSAYRVGRDQLSPEALTERYVALAREYPLVFIEDPFHEDDFAHHAELVQALPGILVVGDDLFVSNPARLRRGIELGAANAVLLKVNQIGTVSEAIAAAELAKAAGYTVTCSLRSHDTEDPFIADFAVAVGAKLIKVGSPVRAERNAKYNRLMAIEAELSQ
jgi:enolase